MISHFFQFRAMVMKYGPEPPRPHGAAGKGAGKPKHQDKQQVSSPEKVKKEAW